MSHDSISAGTWSTWPQWGGTWKWTARLSTTTGRSGTAPSAKLARADAIEALAELNRERQRERAHRRRARRLASAR